MKRWNLKLLKTQRWKKWTSITAFGIMIFSLIHISYRCSDEIVIKHYHSLKVKYLVAILFINAFGKCNIFTITLRPSSRNFIDRPHKRAIKYYEVIWHHCAQDINPLNIFPRIERICNVILISLVWNTNFSLSFRK